VDVAQLYSRLQVGQCIMVYIKLESYDIISLYKKNGSERRRFISLARFFKLLLFIIDFKLN